METDRQDGDGLRTCPVCHSNKVEEFERQEGLFVVSCENDDCIFTVEAYGGSVQDARYNWNDRAPTRDGAEGAGCERCFLEQEHRDSNWIGLSASEKAAYDWPDDTDLHRQCRAAYIAGATDYALPKSAPPKPAPDAMREALASQIEKEGVTVHGVWHPRETVTKMIVDALRSAPVPPADGLSNRVRDVLTLWQHGEREEVHKAVFGTDGKGEGSVCKNLGPYVRSVVADLQRAEAALASEAEACALIVERWLDDTELRKAATDAIRSRSTSPAVAAEPEPNWDKIAEEYMPSTATPPVRGDREAIARIIHSGAFDKKAGSEHQQHEALSKADAILSLRAQPGAGERETLIEECAKVADDFAAYEQTVFDRANADGALSQSGRKSIVAASGSRQVAAEQIAHDIRALSRQAPHSSSEAK